MLDGAMRDRRSELDDPFRNGPRVRFVESLLGDFPDAIQISVIAPDQLDQDRFLGFEVVIQASRENPGGVGNLLEGGAQTRGGDQRSRRLKDLGAPSSIGVGTRHGCAGVLDSSSPLRCHGYAVMPSRSQRPRTSSKIDIGTVNGSVAETLVR